MLGAGMVGICTALALQSRGKQVLLMDRRTPGLETSYGNAGVIQAEAAEPYAMPRDLHAIIQIILGKNNDVSFEIPSLVKHAPALWRYYLASHPKNHLKVSQIYHQLTRASTEDHAALIKPANAEDLISRKGFYYVYRDEETLDKTAKDLERLKQQYGVVSRVLDGRAYQSEESAITASVAGAIHWPQSWTCSDPGELNQRYAELFIQRGGEIGIGDANSLQQSGKGWRVQTTDGPHDANAVVIALGPWSPVFLKQFGYKIPMILKRGYHAHFTAPTSLQHSFVDTANGVVAAPMKQGIRVSSGAALVAHDSPSRPLQLEVGIEKLREILDLGERVAEPQWYGTRPCMPGMLPLIGEAPRHSGMWFNFGHGHQGFTLGPTSGRLLADVMGGDESFLLSGLKPGMGL